MTDSKYIKYKDVIAEAAAAKAAAYAPYSGFKVGAALVTKSGKIFRGCNVENISLGLTICAERAAVAAAISSGERDFEMIVVVTDSENPTLPCGACRQVLTEFAPAMRIVAATPSGKVDELELAALLPKPNQGILETEPRV